jgi:hypothetical protein
MTLRQRAHYEYISVQRHVYPMLPSALGSPIVAAVIPATGEYLDVARVPPMTVSPIEKMVQVQLILECSYMRPLPLVSRRPLQFTMAVLKANSVPVELLGEISPALLSFHVLPSRMCVSA